MVRRAWLAWRQGQFYIKGAIKDYFTKKKANGAALTLTLEDNIATTNIKEQENRLVELSYLQDYFWKGPPKERSD